MRTAVLGALSRRFLSLFGDQASALDRMSDGATFKEGMNYGALPVYLVKRSVSDSIEKSGIKK